MKETAAATASTAATNTESAVAVAGAGATYVSPTFRWILYDDLTEAQLVSVEALDYTETTWNLLGTNPLEQLAFVDLSSAQQTAARQLGFVEDNWDCAQNHYGGYYWSGLETYDLARYWSALGWNHSSWEGILLENDEYYSPATNDLSWSNLTQAQQEAATELCYFQESWDLIPMSDWWTSGDEYYYDDDDDTIETEEKDEGRDEANTNTESPAEHQEQKEDDEHDKKDDLDNWLESRPVVSTVLKDDNKDDVEENNDTQDDDEVKDGDDDDNTDDATNNSDDKDADQPVLTKPLVIAVDDHKNDTVDEGDDDKVKNDDDDDDTKPATIKPIVIVIAVNEDETVSTGNNLTSDYDFDDDDYSRGDYDKNFTRDYDDDAHDYSKDEYNVSRPVVIVVDDNAIISNEQDDKVEDDMDTTPTTTPTRQPTRKPTRQPIVVVADEEPGEKKNNKDNNTEKAEDEEDDTPSSKPVVIVVTNNDDDNKNNDNKNKNKKDEDSDDTSPRPDTIVVNNDKQEDADDNAIADNNDKKKMNKEKNRDDDSSDALELIGEKIAPKQASMSSSSSSCRTIGEIICSTDVFDLFCKLMQAVSPVSSSMMAPNGLEQALDDETKQYTVFVPTNTAMKNLFHGIGVDSLETLLMLSSSPSSSKHETQVWNVYHNSNSTNIILDATMADDDDTSIIMKDNNEEGHTGFEDDHPTDDDLMRSVLITSVLNDILLFHVVPNQILNSTTDLACDAILIMANGDEATISCDDMDDNNNPVHIYGSGNTIKQQRLSQILLPLPELAVTNVPACNGILHLLHHGVLLNSVDILELVAYHDDGNDEEPEPAPRSSSSRSSSSSNILQHDDNTDQSGALSKDDAHSSGSRSFSSTRTKSSLLVLVASIGMFLL